MNKQKYALFIGCTISVRGLNYELSARKVAEKLGIEFVDIQEFSCCGFPLSSIHHDSALAIAARNLALAEDKGLDIITLCSACTGYLAEAKRKLTNNTDKRLLNKVNKKLKDLGYHYNGGVKIKHFARVLYEDIGLDKIKKQVKKSLKGIKVAPHYGCHYIKPSEIYDDFDSPIHPQSLDKLIEVTGATSVHYRDKLQCCGGGIRLLYSNSILTPSSHNIDDSFSNNKTSGFKKSGNKFGTKLFSPQFIIFIRHLDKLI